MRNIFFVPAMQNAYGRRAKPTQAHSNTRIVDDVASAKKERSVSVIG